MSTLRDNEILLSSKDAELVRWCEPYAVSILQHYRQTERKTAVSALSEENRRILVNWICNVTRREHFKSETFWSAVSTLDRYCAINARNSFNSDEMQCIAAACIQIAATYQETALSPSLDDLVETCDNRYKKERLRATCWKITAALSADMYWPAPISFYRHFSQAMRQNTFEHTMTKFIVESTAFARNSLLSAFLPSFLAACALFVGQWCTHGHLPSPTWLSDWQTFCFSDSIDPNMETEIADCLIAMVEWIANFPSIKDMESILRKYSHEELFGVAKKTHLPVDAAAQIRQLFFFTGLREN